MRSHIRVINSGIVDLKVGNGKRNFNRLSAYDYEGVPKKKKSGIWMANQGPSLEGFPEELSRRPDASGERG